MSQLIKAKIDPEQYLKADLALINYPNLSGFAKWVYFYIASRPPGWEIYAAEIAKHCKEGIGKVNTALRELQAEGLLVIENQQDEKTKRFTGKAWKLFGAEVCKALRDAMPSRKSKKPGTGSRAHGNRDLLRSQDLGSSIELDRLSEPTATQAPVPSPEPPQAVARERVVETNREEEPAAGSFAAKIKARAAALARKAPSPEQQARLEERRQQDARAEKLQAEAEARLQAAHRKAYGAFEALPTDQVIDALAAECIKNPEPHKDRKGRQALKAWFAAEGKAHLRIVVDAFRLAQKEGAYSVRFVMVALQKNYGLEVPTSA